MNILFTYPTMFHPQRGGVERVTDLLAKELTKRGHSIYYLHNKTDDTLIDYNYPGRVYFFPTADYHTEINHCFYQSFLSKKEIDIVINQCGAFGDSKLYCDIGNDKTKVISVIHCDPLLNYGHLYHELNVLRDNSFQEKLKRILRCMLFIKIRHDYWHRLKTHYNWLRHNTDRILLLSKHFTKNLKSIVPDINLSKIEAISNPNSYDIENPIDHKENIVLYVGRMDLGQKRPDRMIQLWRNIAPKFPDWTLVMIGGGPRKDKLEQYCKKINLERIQFVGYVEPENFYKRAKILCMTSNHEGFGMVLIEGMAKGVVPLAFESYSSVRDIINNECQLITPFKMAEYEDKLSNIMTDADLLYKLQQQGYKTAQKFVVENIVDQWEQLFKSLKIEAQ